MGYQFDETLSLRIGRIPRSVIILTPHPKNLPLVRFPRVPENIFGWGAQAVKTWGDWSARWDVTTDTDQSFQNPNSFDGLESSLRLQYDFADGWFLAGSLAHDLNDYQTFYALNLGYASEKWGLNAVTYTKESTRGGFVMVTYRLSELVELHGGVDAQYKSGSNQVLGARFFLGDDGKTDLTIDYIHSNFKADEHAVGIRLRRRF